MTGSPEVEIANFAYTYDNNGNIITQQFAHRTSTPDNIYTYDNLDRLTRTDYLVGILTENEQFTYDHLGNRLTVNNRQGVDLTYMHNVANEYSYVGGPVGHWRMNDNAANAYVMDSSANNITATAQQNTEDIDTTGKINGALTFNVSSSDYITLPDDDTIEPDLPITLAAWIKLDTTGTQQHIIELDDRTSGNYGAWMIITSTNKLRAGFGNGTVMRYKTAATTTFSTGTWYHVVAVIKGQNDINLYVNGSDNGGTALGTASTIAYSSGNGFIGCRAGSLSYFDGAIDNVMVFDRALSASEIKALDNTEKEDTVTYDALGNLAVDQNGYQYFYDYENRLQELKDNSDNTKAKFTYDALGRRIEKIEYDSPANITTRYYYDGWRVLSETDAADTVQREYIYGNYLDEVLVMFDTDDHYYAHDHLFSVVALIADDGSIEERYEYDAYGKVTVSDDDFSNPRATSSYGNPYTFTGQRLDSFNSKNLLVMYYKNRYYDTNTGRFLQSDPLGVRDEIGLVDFTKTGAPLSPRPMNVNNQYIDGMSLYEYVNSNPSINVDPSGNVPFSCKLCLGVLGAKFGGGIAGCMIECRGDDTYWDCVKECFVEFINPCELWYQFKRNPGEWIGAGICAGCGIQLIDDIASGKKPKGCDDDKCPYDPDDDPFPIPDKNECPPCRDFQPYINPRTNSTMICRHNGTRTSKAPCICGYTCPDGKRFTVTNFPIK